MCHFYISDSYTQETVEMVRTLLATNKFITDIKETKCTDNSTVLYFECQNQEVKRALNFLSDSDFGSFFDYGD